MSKIEIASAPEKVLVWGDEYKALLKLIATKDFKQLSKSEFNDIENFMNEASEKFALVGSYKRVWELYEE